MGDVWVMADGTRVHQGRAQRQVTKIKFGDLVDLEGDFFADPLRDNPEYDEEYQAVVDISRESKDTVRVKFYNGKTIVFPDTHWVDVGLTVGPY